MARRGEGFARLGTHGGYTQALTVGKGLSSAARSTAKQQGAKARGDGSGGTMNAYARHQELIRNYHRYHLNAEVPSSGAIEARGLPGQRRLTDDAALRRQHRFVRDDVEDRRADEARGLEGEAADPSAWEVRMASKYYKLLFKEYALADLSRYREDKVGLRWRTEKDVVSGKGQFECGALRCQERRDLHSYELNFKYKEAGTVKNELVKVRVCPQCARKLFRKKIEALRRQHAAQQRDAERERRRTAKAAGAGATGGSETESETVNKAIQGIPPPPVGINVNDDAREHEQEEGSASSNLREGHDLVRQAVAAAGGREGSLSSDRKRRRPSRWGDKIAPVVEGGGGGGLAEGMGAGSAGAAVPPTDDASRKAWAGELERDRTAEDEMDDYLSSLLL